MWLEALYDYITSIHTLSVTMKTKLPQLHYYEIKMYQILEPIMSPDS